jgi:hypothetical protein
MAASERRTRPSPPLAFGGAPEVACSSVHALRSPSEVDVTSAREMFPESNVRLSPGCAPNEIGSREPS